MLVTKTSNFFDLFAHEVSSLFFVKGLNKREQVFLDRNVEENCQNSLVFVSAETIDKEQLVVAQNEREPEVVLVSLRAQRGFWDESELVRQFESQILQPVEQSLSAQQLDTIRQNVQLRPNGEEWELTAEIELSSSN